MALNALGLGFLLTAKDMASAVFQKVNRSIGITNKHAKKAGADLDEVGGHLKRVGMGMAAVGIAGVAGLGLAVNQSAIFEKSLAEIRTVVTEAQFPTEQLRKTLQGTAEEFGDPAPKQAAALYSILGAGITDAAKATEILRVSNKLAVGGMTEVEVATDALTSSMNAYREHNLSAKDAADALAKAVDIGKLRFEEIGPQIGRIAPNAARAGIAFDELAASIGVAAQVQKTEQAVEGLNSAIRNILNPTKEAMDEAKRLGIEVGPEAIKAAGGLKQWFDKMTQSAGYSSESLQKLISDSTGQTTAAILLADNSSALTAALGDLANKAGTVDTKFKIVDDTFSQAGKKLKASFINAVISLGDALVPVIKLATAFITRMVQGFNALPGPVKSAIAGFIAFASVGLILLGGLLALVGTVMGLVAAKAVLVAALKVVGIAALALIAILGPLLLLGAGLYVAWTRNIGGFRDYIEGAFNKVRLAFEALKQAFSDGKFSGAVLGELNKVENSGVKRFAVQVFLWFNRIKNFISGIGTGFAAGLEGAQSAITGLIAAFKRLGAAFGLTIDGPAEAGKQFESWGKTGERVGNVLAGVFEFLAKAVSAVVDVITGLVEGFGAAMAVSGGLSGVIDLVVSAYQDMVDAFSAGDSATDKQTSAWQVLGQVVGFIVGAMVAGLKMLVLHWSMMVGVVSGVVGAVVGFVMGLWNIVSDYFSMLGNIIDGNWGAAWTNAKMIAFHAVEAIADILSALLGIILGSVDKIASAFGKDLGLKDALKGGKEDMLKDLRGVMGLPSDAAAPKAAAPVRTGVTTVQHVRPPTPGQPTAATAPGVTAGAGQAQMATAVAALATKPPPATNITVHSHLHMDSAVIAEQVQKVSTAGAARGFSPTPAPT